VVTKRQKRKINIVTGALILALYSGIYCVGLSFDFKLKVELAETLDRVTVVVSGKNLMKEDIFCAIFSTFFR
jgi:hypothetical protein